MMSDTKIISSEARRYFDFQYYNLRVRGKEDGEVRF